MTTPPMQNPKITIWYNDQKGNTNWPFFTGKIVHPDGTVYNVQLWTNVSVSGSTYYSGNLKPFEPKPNPEPIQDPTPSAPKEVPNWNVPASGLFGSTPTKDETDQAVEKAKLHLERAFIERFENTPVDQLSPGDFEQYNLLKAKHKSLDYYGK